MTLWVWRHPPPQGVAGRCIGRTDVTVDPRKAKRLAHRIRGFQRKGLRGSRGKCDREATRPSAAPRVVLTSPLQRSASVGRWLKAWGWAHRVDARLCEMDFGAWDGQRWDDIGAAAVDTWCAAFTHHPAGGGESVAQVLERCAAFIAQPVPQGPLAQVNATVRALPAEAPATWFIVGHAGWISAALWLAQAQPQDPTASDWPGAVRYSTRVRLNGR